jgi:catechol 2,3-dioxygenase-like lactoylglutathione lyase family enzyme
MTEGPRLTDAYLFVRDMNATLAFYGRLGLTFDAAGGDFARAVTPDGLLGLEFGTYALTQSYDPNWQGPGAAAKSTLNFELASREAVDAIYADLTSAGHAGHLAPIDAFWGSRFAIVDDPDGNQVGLQSPRDPARATQPSL